MSNNSLNNSHSRVIWDYKPWWCQPWSILLTGLTIIVGSWLLLKIIWLSSIISALIIIWWVYFLLIYPQMMKEYLTQETTNE